MNRPELTPEQIDALLREAERAKEGNRRRQAQYYQRHSEERKAYAREYYRRKVEKKQEQAQEQA